MTKFVKKSEITSSWFEIDAKNAVVGRLATIISKIIRGKNKNTFSPHMDDGDFVVVKNIEQGYHDQTDDQPQRQVFVKLVQNVLLIYRGESVMLTHPILYYHNCL